MKKYSLFLLGLLGLSVPYLFVIKNIYAINKEPHNFVSNEIVESFKEVVTPYGPYNGNLEKSYTKDVIKSYYGPMTAYGPDCVGCRGITSSDYDVMDGKIYYNDLEYGNIYILASDKVLPFGTIIRIKDLNVFDNDILGIVLDRGSAIGFEKKSYFDLLYPSEKETEFFGKRYATFEILRMGF